MTNRDVIRSLREPTNALRQLTPEVWEAFGHLSTERADHHVTAGPTPTRVTSV